MLINGIGGGKGWQFLLIIGTDRTPFTFAHTHTHTHTHNTKIFLTNLRSTEALRKLHIHLEIQNMVQKALTYKAMMRRLKSMFFYQLTLLSSNFMLILYSYTHINTHVNFIVVIT